MTAPRTPTGRMVLSFGGHTFALGAFEFSVAPERQHYGGVEPGAVTLTGKAEASISSDDAAVLFREFGREAAREAIRQEALACVAGAAGAALRYLAWVAGDEAAAEQNGGAS